MRKGIGSHQSERMQKDEWLTPPAILSHLGEFDLDPCSPITRPWDIAKEHYNINDNGLRKEWFGRVFCNPPYGLQAEKWLKKCGDHRNCIALIFARTETKMFFNQVWRKAHSILFIKGRLYFHHSDGERAKANSGAPSVLISYNEANTDVLKNCDIEGKLIQLKPQVIIKTP